MFKPEMILEDVAVFGLEDTIKLVAAKFRRLGKPRMIADKMAHLLVLNTVFVPE